MDIVVVDTYTLAKDTAVLAANLCLPSHVSSPHVYMDCVVWLWQTLG